MEPLLTIGAFGRRCGLSVSALRFYAECGLLRPAAVDDATGYRYYAEAQLPEAMLIKQLRATEMPVDELKRFLAASPSERQRRFERHAATLERHVEALRRSVDQVRLSMAHAPRTCGVPASVLAAALAQVRFAMAVDDRRPELAGVWMEQRDDSLRLVATDSYRLAVRDLVVDVGAEQHRDARAESDESRGLRGLVGRHQIQLLGSLLTEAGDTTVWLGPRASRGLEATIEGHDVELGDDDGRFPDYEQLLAGLPIGSRAVLARRPLIQALTQSAGASATLRFGTDGDTVEVLSGATRSSMPASWDGPSQEVTVNPAFLTEALRNLVGPDVIIEVSDSLRPVVLRSADTGTLSVWTMPIRPGP